VWEVQKYCQGARTDAVMVGSVCGCVWVWVWGEGGYIYCDFRYLPQKPVAWEQDQVLTCHPPQNSVLVPSQSDRSYGNKRKLDLHSRQTDGQTDRQSNTQTDGYKDGQTNKPFDGDCGNLADRVEVHIHTYRSGCVECLDEGGQLLGTGGEGVEVGHQTELQVRVRGWQMHSAAWERVKKCMTESGITLSSKFQVNVASNSQVILPHSQVTLPDPWVVVCSMCSVHVRLITWLQITIAQE